MGDGVLDAKRFYFLIINKTMLFLWAVTAICIRYDGWDKEIDIGSDMVMDHKKPNPTEFLNMNDVVEKK